MTDLIDVCVVGAGPAGLQAGSTLKAMGLTVRILERGPSVGTFFRKFPRHRQLISINKRHTGLSDPEQRLRFDWNSILSEDGPLFTDRCRRYFPPADDYVAYLEEFAVALADDILCDAEVTHIGPGDDGFAVTLASGRIITARQVVVATGVSLPWLPEIDGLEHVELYSEFDPDPERFTDKRVLILGKGKSAFETADSLTETTQAIHVMSPNPVKLAWNTHFVGHLRAVNNNFLDTYQLKSQNALIDATPLRILKRGAEYVVTAAMSAAQEHEIVLTYDHVIACTGFRFDAAILDPAIRPHMRHMGKYPAMGPDWECDGVPGLWFAGTIMQCRDFKKTMSGFVHGFRHNVAALCHFVAARARGTDYPADRVDLAAEVLAHEIRDRISLSAAMFLQPGFLGDVIRLDGPEAGKRLRDVPIDWAAKALLTEGEHLTVTLEFGDFGANPLHVKRQHNAFGGEPDPFIHPVLRLWRDGEVADMAHLSDHLDSDWRDADLRDPGTVLRMTFADEGRTLPPSEAAHRQLMHFLGRLGLSARSVPVAAAE